MTVVVLVLLTGCVNAPAAGNESSTEPETTNPPATVALPLNVNEAGQIPILMYHRIGDSDSDYDRTAALFRSDLERLYAEGYRPIALRDFVAGRIEVPAGMTPVVITFDDGDKSQYTALENSLEPTADCAVGIMEAFRKDHPDFNPQATFFVNGGVPFGQKARMKEKLNELVRLGYTIGNHTWDHAKLSKLTAEEIQVTLGKNAVALEALTGNPVELLALPYGIRPKDPVLMASVAAGSFEGKVYMNVGICNVGWQPELPPYGVGFDPQAINRIRCGDDQDEAGDWLTRLSENPGQRYISDGDSAIVTVPASKAESIDRTKLGTLTLRVIN